MVLLEKTLRLPSYSGGTSLSSEGGGLIPHGKKKRDSDLFVVQKIPPCLPTILYQRQNVPVFRGQLGRRSGEDLYLIRYEMKARNSVRPSNRLVTCCTAHPRLDTRRRPRYAGFGAETRELPYANAKV